MAFSAIIPNPQEVQRQRADVMTPKGVDPGEGIIEAITNFMTGSKYSMFGQKIADMFTPKPRPSTADLVQQEAAKYLQGGRPDIQKVATGYPKKDWMLANMTGAAQVMMPGGTPLMKQVDVYHGSPHKFDKFKMDKIGTGEGAQAFGHGLYFTSQESIAQDYAKTLSRDSVNINAETDPIGPYNMPYSNTIKNIVVSHKPSNKSELIKKIEQIIDDGLVDKESTQKILDWVKTADIEIGGGENVYKATLHKGKSPDQYDYLDWDKPVTKEIWEKLAKQAETEKIGGFTPEWFRSRADLDRPLKGEGIYNSLAASMGMGGRDINGMKNASQFLLRAGIDGIRYPTGSLSGQTDSGEKNYVVFDEESISMGHDTPESLATEIPGTKFMGKLDTAGKTFYSYDVVMPNGKHTTVSITELGKAPLERAIADATEMFKGASTPKTVTSKIGLSLDSRQVKGDAKLDAMDLAEDIVDKGGEIDKDGYVTLYHRTTEANANKIVKTGQFVAKEDRLFFGTHPEGDIEGYGPAVVQVKLPLEKLQLNDIFANQAHVTLKSGRPGTPVKIKSKLWSKPPGRKK